VEKLWPSLVVIAVAVFVLANKSMTKLPTSPGTPTILGDTVETSPGLVRLSAL